MSDAVMLAGNAIGLWAVSATTTRRSEFLVGTGGPGARRGGRYPRDYHAALRQLEAEMRHTFIESQFRYSPTTPVRGQVQMLARERDLARQSFEAARLELEQKVLQTTDDHPFHSSLGIAYAGLGRRVEAVREAKLGCNFMPASKDAWRALRRVEDLALVYTMVGQPSEAIAQLEHLLGGSGEFTAHVLRLEPRWDPVRSDPRSQALLTKVEVKPDW